MKGGRVARRQGQIISRGDHRWLVRIFLGRDPETRRRIYSNHTLRGSLHAAHHFLSTRLAEREAASDLEGARITLDQYLDRWLELAARPKLRAKSFKDYTSLLNRYIRPALGERKLCDLAPLDVQSAVDRMNQKKLSPRTVGYTHAVLHAALEHAVRWRLTPRNPARGVALPKSTRHEMHVLKPDQARRFLSRALPTKYGTLFALALTAGMRPSEYLALRWSDVNWQDETVTVRRTLEKGSGWQFADTKRPCSRRQVKLESWVAGRLWHLYIRERSIPDLSPPVARPIFRTRTGQPINSDSLAREFKRLLREAGLPPMCLYSLRHTAATLALSAGVPAKVVSEQLGHATSAFTLDVYSHVLPHMQAEAAERVEALLGMAEERESYAGRRKPPQSVFPDYVPLNGQQFVASRSNRSVII
jgi:integrase